MITLTALVQGSLRAAMESEIRDAASVLRRGVARAGAEVQTILREQARGAGFSDGGRAIANAWRLRVFPDQSGSRSLRPAALVFSKAPRLVLAFESGREITVRRRRWLAIPTGYNAAGGRRNASSRGGLRVTAEQMVAARGQAFVIRSKSNRGAALWCLRVRTAAPTGRRRRLRLVVAAGTEVLTGHARGHQARAQQLLNQGFIPMFVLLRSVRLRKRLDVAGVRARAPMILANALAAELGTAA